MQFFEEDIIMARNTSTTAGILYSTNSSKSSYEDEDEDDEDDIKPSFGMYTWTQAKVCMWHHVAMFYSHSLLKEHEHGKFRPGIEA